MTGSNSVIRIILRYCIQGCLCGFLGAIIFPPCPAGMEIISSQPYYAALDGHLRLRGSISFPENNSRLDFLGHDRLHDGAFEFRLKNQTGYSDWLTLDAHYEMVGSGGEAKKTRTAFLTQYPEFAANFQMPGPVSDDRRVMDLTRVFSSDDQYLAYHRMDRLSLTATGDRGAVVIGRQALTWGNGFLFNPMDLFNPFSPTDVERDYKIGDDMITARLYTGDAGELQILYVPRRNTENHDIEWDQSSVAAKYHLNVRFTDIDLMAGKHYEDTVFGVGGSGYLKQAAWRLDATWTVPDDDGRQSGFLSIVANMDYSWVWWNKNMYGWIEYYYTGLGKNDVPKALTDPNIRQRLERGEWFTVGRSYVNAQLRLEWHPLINGFITVITNTADLSAVVQPRITWDPMQNFQIMCGANIYSGKSDTEFGGFEVPGLELKEVPPDMVYLWLSWYF